MERGFVVDESLLRKARAAFHDWPKLYWILGGSCTGKSAVAGAISDRTLLQVVDMDVRIYDRFTPAYRIERHPASKTRFGAENPLNWALSLSWDEFDALNRATDAEVLDLLADEVASEAREHGLIIDGGFTHPSLLARVVPASRTFVRVDRRAWR